MNLFKSLFSQQAPEPAERIEPDTCVSRDVEAMIAAMLDAAADERREPVAAPAPAPEPVPVLEPEPVSAYVPTSPPEAFPATTEPAPVVVPAEEQKEMSKRVFVAFPCEGRTQAEVQQMSAATVAFVRAIYAAKGEQVDVVSYGDYFAQMQGGSMNLLRIVPAVFGAAQQCNAAFFSDGCDRDRVLEMLRLALDDVGMPYHCVMYKQA